MVEIKSCFFATLNLNLYQDCVVLVYSN